jgi:hypothetical protein
MTRSVITIATGKELYVRLAINLARSFFWWHKDTDINFILVTDLDLVLPADLTNKVQLKHINADEVGTGFSSKLYLDKLAPQGQTLFIDSDCLVFGNLNWLFERFKGHAVSVVGNYMTDGEWFGNITQIRHAFNLPHLPKFNGGIYYLEKGEKASAVYGTARDLEKRYDEIGFVRLRNKPNDEVLMALAMQLHDQQPVIDDNTIMSDPQAYPGDFHVNVIIGNRWLSNGKKKISPVIVHFLGDYTHHYLYKINVYRLQNIYSNRLLTELMGLTTIAYPALIKTNLKNLFRPIYHFIGGYRKIKPSERL